jgi:hypothetical protein
MAVIHGQDRRLASGVSGFIEVPGCGLIDSGEKSRRKSRQSYFVEIGTVVLEAEQAEDAQLL